MLVITHPCFPSDGVDVMFNWISVLEHEFVIALVFELKRVIELSI